MPAKLFSGYLGNLPAGLLELTGSPTRASVKAERSNYDFHALPPDEYPPLPAAQKGASFAINAKKFREGVDATIFAASGEEARGAVLMGTLLEIEGDNITMVATDGYRLAKWSARLERGSSRDRRSTSSRRARWPKRRAISAAAETLEVTALGAQANQLCDRRRRDVDRRAARRRAVSQLRAGDSGQVRPLGDGQHQRLIGGLRRAELVAGDRASMVKVAIADGRSSSRPSPTSPATPTKNCEVEQTGDDLTIAFNARYLVEILNHVDSPQSRDGVSGTALAGRDPAARSERSAARSSTC